MNARRILLVSFVSVLLLVIFVLWLFPRHSNSVLAQSGWVAGSLGDTSGGGMAQYGAAELTSTSSSSDLQALTNWNNYINARCGWSLSSADLSRLANADYNARQASAAKITPQQLANAINSIVNSTLNTMSASQQQSLFDQEVAISVPNGEFLVNTPDQNVSATQNSNGTWTVNVSANEFSARKSFYQTYAPSMVSSSSNFYPGEAIMVTYSLASGDFGYNNSFISSATQLVGNATGVSMSSNLLYGDNGYMIRRPMHAFLTESNISQFFSDLGF